MHRQFEEAAVKWVKEKQLLDTQTIQLVTYNEAYWRLTTADMGIHRPSLCLLRNGSLFIIYGTRPKLLQKNSLDARSLSTGEWDKEQSEENSVCVVWFSFTVRAFSVNMPFCVAAYQNIRF